jgi:hypothetical protein
MILYWLKFRDHVEPCRFVLSQKSITKVPSTKISVLLPNWLEQGGDIFGMENRSQKDSKSSLTQCVGLCSYLIHDLRATATQTAQ